MVLPAIVSASVWALTEEGHRLFWGNADNEFPILPSSEVTWEEWDTAYMEEMWHQPGPSPCWGVSLPWLCCSSEVSALGLWGWCCDIPKECLGTGKWHTGLGLIGGSVAETATEFLLFELPRSHLHHRSQAEPVCQAQAGGVTRAGSLSASQCLQQIITHPHSQPCCQSWNHLGLEKPFKII